MPTTVVNAYYHPMENNVSILAAILQPPFFSVLYDDPSVYAGIGMIIGHEIFHGVDPHGINFDENGSYNPSWMDPQTLSGYGNMQQCLVNQYTQRTMYGHQHDGYATAAENIADQLGFQAAFRAANRASPMDEMQKAQFYMAYAQAWCSKTGAAADLMRTTHGVHSVPEFRINRVLENQDEWLQSHGCPNPPPCDPL